MTLANPRNTHAETTGRERPAHPHPRRRGSLLILIVTVLVIIALVGIAFLQRVRIDQAATARFERSNVDQVISGILTEISTQLRDDVFENAENAKELYDYPWTKNEKQIQDDYYFTGNPVFGNLNGSGTAGVMDHEDDRWLASTAPVYNHGNRFYHWLHLTNLTNFWLDLPQEGNPTETVPTEHPINQNASHPTGSDTNLRLRDGDLTGPGAGDVNSIAYVPTGYQQRGFDTDLDGILDAKWQWAPTSVRDIGGVQYVMAVRIIDLASMVNLNTATAGTSNGFTPLDGPGNPNVMRGWDTTGIELTRLMRRIQDGNPSTIRNSTPGPGSFSGWDNVRDEIQAIIDHRSLQNTSQPLITNPPVPFSAKVARDFWEKQATIYGNLDRNYLTESEFDLRKGAGVNDYSVESELEADMPLVLRQNQTYFDRNGAEGSFESLVSFQNNDNFERMVGRWFYGFDPGNLSEPNTDATRVSDRVFRSIRHMLTTAGGAATFVTNYGNAASDINTVEPAWPGDYEIQKFDIGQSYNDTLNLRDKLEQALLLVKVNPGDNYLGLTDGQVNDLIDDYIAVIQDYSDSDSQPEEYNGYFGLERLPFLREAYFHQLYAYTGDNIDSGGNPAPDTVPDTWISVDDSEGLVIELGNPFSHKIEGEDLAGLVRIAVEQGGAVVSTWDFTYATPDDMDMDGRDDNNQNDTLIIVSNPLDNSTDNNEGTGTDLEADLNLTGAPNLATLPNADKLFFNANGDQISILLQIEDPSAPGTWITYDRMDTDADFGPDYAPTNAVQPLAFTPPLQHAQRVFQRNSEDLNFISIDSGDGSDATNPENPPASGSPGAFDNSIHTFQNDNKAHVTVGSWTVPVSFQLPLADRPMRSVTEMAMVHMFGFTRTVPFSERIGDPTFRAPNADQHYLVIDPDHPDYAIIPSPSDKNIPHAAVLFDVFTTVSPYEDGEDNDNDDGDDDPDTDNTFTAPDIEASIDNFTERFVPGVINVNTATLPVLALATPLAEDIDDVEDLMRLIISYRDAVTKNLAGYTNDPATPAFPSANIRQIIRGPSDVYRPLKPGIGSIGELLYMNLNRSNSSFNMQRYGFDTADGQPQLLDLYPEPDAVEAASPTATRIALPSEDGNFDDNEQFLARFQMLSQALTVRSDTYAAHVVVRGYRQNQFNRAPVETAQFIAVFNRGAMEDDQDQVDIKLFRLR